MSRLLLEFYVVIRSALRIVARSAHGAIAVERARRKARQGKSPSTVAGEFFRNEIEEVRRGERGARNVKQAIAVGFSKARRAGVPLPAKGSAQAQPRRAPCAQSASRTAAFRIARSHARHIARHDGARSRIVRAPRNEASTASASCLTARNG